MKAVVLEKINESLTVGEVELGTLLKGQVLVKILVSGICGAQLQEIAGHKGNANFVPHLLGHEGCGIVEEIGEGVTKVKKGDKVVMHWRKGEGIESDFPNYKFNGKSMTSGKLTTLSEFSIVSENRITPVPFDTPPELCALLGCGLSTALGTIKNEADVKPNESVLIAGFGGLGINLLKAAKLAKAYPIITVDINEEKRLFSDSLGADFYINAKTENIKEKLMEKFNIKDIDVIIDTTGNKKSIEDTLQLLSGKGRFIMVGQPKPGEDITIFNALHFFGGEGKSFKATQGGRFNPTVDIPFYLEQFKLGTFNIDGIITHKMKLDDVNVAVDLLKKGNAGRILFEM